MEQYNYNDIPVEWFLGDFGELSDYNQIKPSIPGQFHPQLARLFLEYIQIGLTNRQACMEVPMNERWPRSWGRGSNNAPDNYGIAFLQYAKPLQFDTMASDIVDITDGTDALANEKAIINAIPNPLRDTLGKSVRKNIEAYHKMVGDRVASRKWFVSKMAPARYGDKVQIDHGNAGGRPFKTINHKDLTDEQLDSLLEMDEELNS